MRVSPAFDRRLAELSPDSDRVWLAGLSTGLALTIVAAFAPLPAAGGTMCAYLGLVIRASLYLRAGETLRERGGAVLPGLFRLGIDRHRARRGSYGRVLRVLRVPRRRVEVRTGARDDRVVLCALHSAGRSIHVPGDSAHRRALVRTRGPTRRRSNRGWRPLCGCDLCRVRPRVALLELGRSP